MIANGIAEAGNALQGRGVQQRCRDIALIGDPGIAPAAGRQGQPVLRIKIPERQEHDVLMLGQRR
jgi:hypothetical protein